MSQETIDNTSRNTRSCFYFIDLEMDWLHQVFTFRLNQYFSRETTFNSLADIQPPALEKGTPYSDFIINNQLNYRERLLLILTLAPHLSPDFLDKTIYPNIQSAGDFPRLGGTKGENFRGFLPTGDTIAFLLEEKHAEERFNVLNMFRNEHLFARKQVLHLGTVKAGEPELSGKIIINSEYVEYFTTRNISKPKLGAGFPAQQINTRLEWEDLVLNNKTFQQIKELENWIMHHKTLLYDWNMQKRINPGFRALFYGPPGTGKTLTASLLGKYTGKDVFRIDLSMVVSKYIGETEKNLATMFNKAENRDWILFFDEADALFGKRTNVRDAHDKHANQEVSYLLQRVEQYPGLVILASNFKSNIDEAFTRRFQSLIYFPMPKASERLTLWKNAFPEAVTLANNVDLEQLAKKYETSGANIMNIVQFACLKTLSRGESQIYLEDLMEGIEKEYGKEGKMV